MVSYVHQVCKTNNYIAIISATAETQNPEKELEPAFQIIGSIKEKFVTVRYYMIFCYVNTIIRFQIYMFQVKKQKTLKIMYLLPIL